jgi:hypothetical protein
MRVRGGTRRSRRLDNLGGHSGGDTPLPIPNREVKPASADGTRGASPRESRTPPTSFADRDPRVGISIASVKDARAATHIVSTVRAAAQS